MASRGALILALASFAVASAADDPPRVSLLFGHGGQDDIVQTTLEGTPIFIRFDVFDNLEVARVNLALGDLNGDGVPERVCGESNGGRVSVFDGVSGTLAWSGTPYGAGFTSGVHVAVGDVNGDGLNDLITGAGAGSPPTVKCFSGLSGVPIGEFLAYESGFLGGVRVAAGDWNGDGNAEIITAPGPGRQPQINVFRIPGVFLYGFFAYGTAFQDGVAVASGDFDGDGRDDIVTAPLTGARAVCKFRAASGGFDSAFFPYTTTFGSGIRVAVGDVNEDGKDDVIVGPGADGGEAKKFDGTTNAEITPPLNPFGSGHVSGFELAACRQMMGSFFDVFLDVNISATPPPVVLQAALVQNGVVVERDFQRVTIGTNNRFWFDRGYGLYDVYLKLPTTLGQRINGVQFFPPTTIPTQPFFSGDTNGDDRINIADFVVFRGSYGSAPGNVNWNSNCDFNYDNSIGIADFLILRNNFGKAGPGPF